MEEEGTLFRVLCCIPAILGVLCLTGAHLILFGYFVSRVLIIFYPLIILIEADFDQYFGLQWCVLLIFTVLYIGIFILLFTDVSPIIEALNLIRPYDKKINLTLRNNTMETMKRKINICYGVIQLSKYIQEVLIHKFGDDVALIIVEYAFDEWMFKK